jgi:uncharacterized protein YlxW (UPF0749 family)
MRRLSSRIAVSIVLFALGFLAVAQLNAQNPEGLTALSVAELTELVANVTTRNNQLRQEVETLQRQRDSLAATVERGDNSAGQIRSDLNRILAWSGATGVRGPGVRVTVAGPVPGDALELLLNELRNAGADAIAVGDVRVVPGVVATGPEGATTIAGILVPDPAAVYAVGQPQTLAGSLSRAGGPIAQLAARFPTVQITVTALDEVTVPATDRDLNPRLGRPRL